MRRMRRMLKMIAPKVATRLVRKGLPRAVAKNLTKRVFSYLFQEYWTQKVTPKWSPPPGLFKEGTSKQIAKVLYDNSVDLKQAMARLNFYINRAGQNLSEERRKVLEDAKEELRKLFYKKPK